MNKVENNPEATQALTEMQTENQGVSELKFTKINTFTTFTAEFAIVGDDLVFHFFLPPELLPHLNKSRDVQRYWKDSFPEVLEPVVKKVFQVGAPRIQATYVADFGVNSWWMKANGFANGLDPEGLCSLFFEQLDKELDFKIKSVPTSIVDRR